MGQLRNTRSKSICFGCQPATISSKTLETVVSFLVRIARRLNETAHICEFGKFWFDFPTLSFLFPRLPDLYKYVQLRVGHSAILKKRVKSIHKEALSQKLCIELFIVAVIVIFIVIICYINLF